MLRLASLSTLAFISSLALLACDKATIAHGSGGGGAGGDSNSTSSSTSSSGGGGQSPTNACTQAGGTCVGITPGNACSDGMWGDATLCGSGVGVGCCLPAPTCGETCNTEGAKRCFAGSIETCAADPKTNCAPVWGSAVPCAQNEMCNSDGTACVAAASTCDSNADCGCGCACGSGTCLCTGGVPPTCTVDSDCGPSCAGFKCISGTCQAPVCQPGADQTCNDSASMSGLAGKCNGDATCTCNTGYSKKPSGKCG